MSPTCTNKMSLYRITPRYLILITLMAAYLKLNTLNCQGLNCKLKRAELFEFLKRQDAHVHLLQETKCAPHNESKWSSEWGRDKALFSSCTRKKMPNKGVAILINHPAISFKKWDQDLEGRLIAANLQIYGEELKIINVYAPNVKPGQTKENDRFFENVHQFFAENTPTILAGDFNIVDNPLIDKDPPSQINAGNNELKMLCKTHDIKDYFRILEGQDRQFSWRDEKNQSRIDRFYLSDNIKATKIDHIFTHLSDHKIVKIHINVKAPPPQGKRRWINNVKIYKYDPFLKALKEKWPLWTTLKTHLFENPSDWWIEIKRKFTLLTRQYTKRMNAEHNATSLALLKEYENATALLSDNKTTYREYLDAKRNLRKHNKQQTIAKLAKNRRDEEKRGSKAFFAKYKAKQKQTLIEELYDENFLPTSNPKEMAEIARSFYSHLYESAGTNQSTRKTFLKEISRKLTPEKSDSLETPISYEEIETAIRTLKLGKSPGPDGITAEMYKECWPIIKTEVKEVLQYWFANKIVPKEIKRGIVTIIHKKGDNAELKNYRPITLLNLDYKIYSKILTNRFNVVLPDLIGENQCAMIGRTIAEGTTLIRDLYQHSVEKGQEAFFLSLDFEKAFDSVEQNWLRETLNAMRFPKHIQGVIENLYDDSAATVVVNGYQSAEIKLKRGVRQGDPLSFLLFLIAIEPLTEKLKNTPEIRGIRLTGRRETKSVSYADDVTLTLKDAPAVDKALNVVATFQLASGLKLNKQKSQGLIVNSDAPAFLLPDIKWNRKTINLLGITIGNIDLNRFWQKVGQDVDNKINELEKTYASLDAKEILIKSKLLAVSNNAAQTFPPSEKEMKKINERVKSYATGKNTSIDITILQRQRSEGGLSLPNFEIYADLVYLRSIKKYCRTRIMNEPLNAHHSYVEYQIGHTIADTLEVAKLNNLPHAESRSPYYEKVIQIIKKYKLVKIDLIENRVRKTYDRIIDKMKPNNANQNPKKWERVHLKMLPSHLRTFNYRLTWNLLPFHNDVGNYEPTTKSGCPFCGIGPDGAHHIFVKCPRTIDQWYKTKVFAENTLNIKIGNEHREDVCALRYRENIGKDADKILVVIMTTLNHQIWKTRNKCIFENEAFSPNKLEKAVRNALNYRLKTLRRNCPEIGNILPERTRTQTPSQP
ncbi:unnamed protein product [Clavelina lepadiformis]|uniref:Reverse transcriptase domain-containing protein n=1 Tax=Clavelina lepadiformis TaxID=159417 RepID=A0ABP0GHS9_CLALP